MRKLILVATLFSTLSTFANVYDGVGSETEYGIENCGMNVLETTNTGTHIIAFGLGAALELFVPNSGEFDQEVEVSDYPKRKLSIDGTMKDGKPITFTVNSSDESMTCNF